MRKEYGKALRELFAARMRAAFPEWAEVKPPAGWYWPGERVFAHAGEGGAWRVVIVAPDLKDHDAFDVQVGWSRLARIPELTMRPSMDHPGGEGVDARDEYVCSLVDLMPRQPSVHRRWVIDPRTYSTSHEEISAAFAERQVKTSAADARAVITPFVDDAMAAFEQFGIPFLDDRLRVRGAT